MFAGRRNSFLLMALLSLSGSLAPVAAQDVAARARTNLIVILKETNLDPNMSALDLLRRRLPLVVSRGRFSTDDGVASVCVYARRSAALSSRTEPGLASMPPCPMITLIVDGTRMSDPGGYLDTTRLSALESIELVSSAEANLRYGFGAAGAEVLALWTRGRGPHAGPSL